MYFCCLNSINSVVFWLVFNGNAEMTRFAKRSTEFDPPKLEILTYPILLPRSISIKFCG